MSIHGGTAAVRAARAHGAETMFTLSGAHVFPMYDAAVGGADSVRAGRRGPMRLIDVRHEQTAVFAAEATGRLTRIPGLAVLTAGPGVTNGVSAIANAHAAGSPLVVVGGRAPDGRWGSGALQELDHPEILRAITKQATTVHDPAGVGPALDDAFMLARTSHRGPVFVDVGMDILFTPADSADPVGHIPAPVRPDAEALDRIASLAAERRRPVLIVGSDVWADGAEVAAAAFAEATGMPVIANGMGRGILPSGHPLLVTRARSHALRTADLVIVAGTPLDFRLGYGRFNDGAAVVHLADSAGQVARHAELAGTASGSLLEVFDGLLAAWTVSAGAFSDWAATLRDRASAAFAEDRELLTSAADPVHPARVIGEVIQRLTADTVVIGDGGDFVSFAGRFIEPAMPGRWLDPGPYGCLGTGPGYAMAARIAHPQSPVVLLLGDGAAGFSLMDVDTLVRHDLPVVMVVGNNAGWGLERHPMRFLYGYDVAADLRPTAYDDVVRALGGAGETVTRPDEIGAAIDRALAAGVPYLINVHTDPELSYPRSTTGV